MATIDQYNHRLLGFIHCPSDYEIVFENPTKQIAIYELEQNIPAIETEMDGKKGDVLIGGGKGEAPVLRLSMPDCLNHFFGDNKTENPDFKKIIKSFWSPTQACILCNGFIKIGWETHIDIEYWLAQNICAYLVKSFNTFSSFNSDKIIIEKRLFSNLTA